MEIQHLSLRGSVRVKSDGWLAVFSIRQYVWVVTLLSAWTAFL